MTLSELQILAMKAVRVRVQELNAVPEVDLPKHLSEIAWLLQIEKACSETSAYESMNSFIESLGKAVGHERDLPLFPNKKEEN